MSTTVRSHPHTDEIGRPSMGDTLTLTKRHDPELPSIPPRPRGHRDELISPKHLGYVAIWEEWVRDCIVAWTGEPTPVTDEIGEIARYVCDGRAVRLTLTSTGILPEVAPRGRPRGSPPVGGHGPSRRVRQITLHVDADTEPSLAKLATRWPEVSETERIRRSIRDTAARDNS